LNKTSVYKGVCTKSDITVIHLKTTFTVTAKRNNYKLSLS